MAEQDEARALDAETWERRAAECRETMSRLSWLVGSWRGHGQHAGIPRICEVESRLLFDGSFLESRERIFTSSGMLEHEDVTIYAAHPEVGPGILSATAYMVGGLVVSYRVSATSDTVVCDPEGIGARLHIGRTEGGYVVRIFYPDDDGSWGEDAVVTYSSRQ